MWIAHDVSVALHGTNTGLPLTTEPVVENERAKSKDKSFIGGSTIFIRMAF